MQIHGRAAERARVRDLVDRARAGAGGALVVHGEPGVGKSTLLQDLIEHVTAAGAEGTRKSLLLRTQGIESEAPLPFAALQRLLQPLMGLADQIPAPQARALRIAFGEQADPASAGGADTPTGGRHGDRFLVFLGTMNLLAAAAQDQPVVALVDDAHWLDQASTAALLFAARRVELEPVAMLFAARDGDVRTFDAGDLPDLHLEGLDRAGVSALLSDSAEVHVSAEVIAQLVAATGGTPWRWSSYRTS